MLKIKTTKHYISGELAGLRVEDHQTVQSAEDAREFANLTEDLHLQYELSGGAEGWCTEPDGAQFVYMGAVICAGGVA